MPVFYLRKLTGRDRSHRANRQLAHYLAFIAGAVNAGGFLAVHQYTSHMSGIIASMADNFVLGNFTLVIAAAAAVLSFMSGAACTSIMVHAARRRELQSEFALPLLLEAALLAVFAFTARMFGGWGIGMKHVEVTILLLCFAMGLQNAMITKISGAVIRTTHMTGMVTDIGIEVGQHLYAFLSGRATKVDAEDGEGWLLASLIALFSIGGICGAAGFRRFNFLFSLPFAALLLILAVVPVIDDLRSKAL